MKKLLAALAAVLIVVIGIWVISFTDSEVPPLAVEQSQYFGERLVTLAVEDIGQPIEGFDADLLMLAYPGLLPQDFDGVETLEGEYEYRRGELEFGRREEELVSSAERTVSEGGYTRLLANVALRLDAELSSAADVDELIDRINTGEVIETRIDQGASFRGLKVVPTDVLEDSRCPADAECIQAGTVRLHASIMEGEEVRETDFTLGEPQAMFGRTVTLVGVTPLRVVGSDISANTYVFSFSVLE